MNINKYIAQSGLASRRGADEIIKAGRVKINENIAKPIDKLLENDRVFVDGKLIKPINQKVYLLFNKPVGVITTTDKNAKDNIIDYIKYPTRIFPVGRLDVKTSGLIILTNDGEIVNKILKGKEKIEKEYLVEVDKSIDDNFIQKMQKGVMIDGYRTLPARLKKIGDRTFSIIIVEGKNRQIRRMCERFGFNVLNLQRVRIGKLTIDQQKIGEYRELKKQELAEKLDIHID